MTGLLISGIDIPKTCRECDAMGISDVVGIPCPVLDDCELYDYRGRPVGCPLEEHDELLCNV